MRARRSSRLAALLCFAALATVALTFASPASAAPLYDLKATWGPTVLPPGGEGQFEIQARNVSEQTSGQKALTIADVLPAGLSVEAIRWKAFPFVDLSPSCKHEETAPQVETVSCTLPKSQTPKYASGRGIYVLGATYGAEPSGYLPLVEVEVHVEAGAEGPAANRAYLYGGEGALPDGTPCAQKAEELTSLPPCAEDEDQVAFGSSAAPFGLAPGSFGADFFGARYPLGKPSRRAGAHPFEYRFDFDLNSRTQLGPQWRQVVSVAPVKTVEATLPRGAVGNPEALPKCDPIKFAERGSTSDSTACPANTQVGYINVLLPSNGGGEGGFAIPNELLARTPIYNLVPPRGQVADLGFNAGGLVQAHIYPTLAPTAKGYAIKTVSPDISAAIVPRGAEVTIWGVPADPAHDWARYYPEEVHTGESLEEGGEKVLAAGAPFEGTIRPFFTNPMDCGEENGGAKISIDSYVDPGHFTPIEEYPNPDNVEGCEDARFRFEPKVSLAPTDRHAGAATGLAVELEVPQRSDEVKSAEELYAEEEDGSPREDGPAQAIATPPLKKAVVTLPEGMSVNPSAAQGLGSCTLAQIGFEPRDGGYVPNEAPVRCPDASQYGTLTLHTPLLPETAPMQGRIFVAQPYANPFGTFLALYLVFDDPDRGILVKISGKVELDEATGQITTEFDDLPQVPASEVEMKIKSGVRAGLVEPRTCGTKTIEATFYTWQDPSTPHPFTNHYEISQNPDGQPCFASLAERPFDPQLVAGAENDAAGAFSPLGVELTRTDEDQELSAVEGTAPPGLTASLRGISRCSNAQIDAAKAPARTGAEELASPSCPAASQVGTVDAGAGVGQALTFVKGKVYLAGPYKGAPLSGVAIVPAVAGPFDLGTVVTRAPAYLDPETAQITLKTDPLPQIFKGVPLHTRDIRVHLDRKDFTLNPTSCEEMHFTGTLFSTEGKQKPLENRFQAADCASLSFGPRLSIRLRGGTRRGAHPALRAVVRPRPGDANIARAAVALPHSAFLDQSHIRTICTRVQFAAGEGNGASCPRGAIYGYARAWTPLLDEPLQGPVYLRSSSHQLPDLVAALKGPASTPLAFDLDGRIDSIHGGIRNTFEAVPDAPVSRFVLTMQGGRKGLLVNSTDICTGSHRANAIFGGQNGRRSVLHPTLKASCRKRHRKHAHRHRKRARRHHHR
jgi:hypothetical protein